MTEIVEFKNWAKLELRIGQIKNIDDKITINCGEKDFQINLGLDVNKGDKIVVGIGRGGLVIPVVNDAVPLTPEKDIDVGCRVS
ncbi:MAG: hypothetical protein KKB31_05390 [Nanoarchaeota archaeon]|nr:hypothetical protein [Nanoarchaeota archaeon]